MEKFKVVRCPRCGQLQTSSAGPNGFMRCAYCSRKSKMRYYRKADQSSGWAVKILYSSDSEKEAIMALRNIKNKEVIR